MSRRPVVSYALLVALGVALGLVGARCVFVNSGLSLIPWGIAAALIGAAAPSRARTVIGAAVFGFALAMSFMLFGYDGEGSLLSVVAPFCLLGLVGAVCAVLMALSGRVIRQAITR